MCVSIARVIVSEELTVYMDICIYGACERHVCEQLSLYMYICIWEVYANKTRPLCLCQYICTCREGMCVRWGYFLPSPVSLQEAPAHRLPPPIAYSSIYILTYLCTGLLFPATPPGQRSTLTDAPAALRGVQGPITPTRPPQDCGTARPLSHTTPPRSILFKYLHVYVNILKIGVHVYVCTYISFKFTHSYHKK